jgi:hypothetical protein
LIAAATVTVAADPWRLHTVDMSTRRRASVALIVMIGGVAIAVGALLPWVAARGARPASGIGHTSIAKMFRWSYETSSFVGSFGLVLLVAGVLVLVSGLLAARVAAAVFSFIALVVAGLWIALNANHFNPVDMPYSELRVGAWLAIGGGLVGLIGAFFLRRRPESEF